MKRNIYIMLLLSAVVGLTNCSLWENDFFNQTDIDQENYSFQAYSSGVGITEGVQIAKSSDGYVLLGTTDTGNEKNYFIVKTDENGNILASKLFGDSQIDNMATGVLIDDSQNIFVLGDRIDRFYDVRKKLPYITSYDAGLNNEIAIWLDVIRGNNGYEWLEEIREERSVGFFKHKDKLITVTNSYTNFDSEIILYGVSLDPSSPIQQGNYSTIFFPQLASINPDGGFYQATQIKQKGDYFYVIGFYDYGGGRKGTFIIKGYLNGNQEEMEFDFSNSNLEYAFSTAINPTVILDFEVLSENKLAVLYRKDKDLKLHTINFSSGTMSFQDEIPLGALDINDQVLYTGPDTTPSTFNIIDRTKSATLSKLNNYLFITAVKDSSHALIVDRRVIDNGEILRDTTWVGGADVWNTEQPFNNISSVFEHRRNNIGNVIPLHDGGLDDKIIGYGIIGTHDFLDDTKMIFMQLDENGSYRGR